MVAKKKVAKKATAKKKAVKSKEAYTHIDRSNGELLRKSDLNKKKPWISPISGQATVEELTQEEKDSLK